MNPSPTILSRSAEVRPVYDEVRIRRARWAALQTIPQAQAAYETGVAAETNELAALQQRRDDLEDAKRRLEPSLFIAPIPSSSWQPARRLPGWRPPWEHVFVPAEPPPGQGAALATRIKLKKLINRWQFVWGLEPGVQAQINQIADSPDRPLGEALSLLPWAVFENPAHPGESSEDHLARLTQWGEALREYSERLQEEIETLRLRYYRWLGIWEHWCACGWNTQEGPSPVQKQRWEEFLEASRQYLRRKMAQVQSEIARLRDVIDDVPAGSADARGPGGLP